MYKLFFFFSKIFDKLTQVSKMLRDDNLLRESMIFCNILDEIFGYNFRYTLELYIASKYGIRENLGLLFLKRPKLVYVALENLLSSSETALLLLKMIVHELCRTLDLRINTDVVISSLIHNDLSITHNFIRKVYRKAKKHKASMRIVERA